MTLLYLFQSINSRNYSTQSQQLVGVYFNNLVFQNNIRDFFKLFETALIWASQNGHTEIVKILVKQEGIDINAKNEIYFNNLKIQNNI